MQDSMRSGRRSVGEMAAEIGVPVETLRRCLSRMSIRTTHAPGSTTGEKYIPLQAETRIIEKYADRADLTDLEDWPDAVVAARMLGIGRKVFLDRVRDGRLTVERRRTSAPGVSGVIYGYNPVDLRRAAAGIPVRPRSVPRGALGVEALAALLGISGNAVRHWSDNYGCPDGRTLAGRRYLHVSQALTWLSARPDPEMQPARGMHARHIQRLTLWIEEHT